MPARFLVPVIQAIIPTVISSLSNSSVPAADRARVAQEVAERVAPMVAHQSNAEPWYRSRVTLGSLASVLTGISTVLMMFSTGDFDPQQVTLAAGALFGGAAALWGRWAAKKPIGR